ncbi:alpha/beta fold hydrolase [Nonomuraea indica]|uniref:Alpha/beta fold hydrolase n=1 Tax=Nonomuraea indica TaxID=1581193 RepID=A0ABW8A3V1_9ACTN
MKIVTMLAGTVVAVTALSAVPAAAARGPATPPSGARPAVPAVPEQAGDAEGRVTGTFPHECAAATRRCDGTLTVPLDWSDPSSERITVAFAWLPARNRASNPATGRAPYGTAGRGTDRATGTILANPGGPLPALPAVPALQRTLGPALDHQNLLVVEPRGMGRSSPLSCPGLDLSAPDTIAACARHLGPRARFFTADQVVADMDAVRRALGVSKVTFFGTSYGTLYAQAYAIRHPDSLAAAFLDSGVITTADGYAPWPMRTRLDSMELVCGRSAACRALPGTPTGTWHALVARLRAQPDRDVPMAAALAVSRNVYQPVFGREATAAATAYLSGDPAPLRRLARAAGAAPAPPVTGPDWAGYLAHRCGDGAFPFDRDADPAERTRQIERHFATERPLAPFEPADLGVGSVAALEFCVRWPTPRHSPPLPPTAPRPAVPIMAVAGDFDTHTPADVADALRHFPGAVVSRVVYAGHSLTSIEGPAGACVRAAMRAFLSDPAHRIPAVRCGAENYRAAGAFPPAQARVRPVTAHGLSGRERRLLAAVFATAADAASRRNPYALTHLRLRSEPGLRGGQVRFDDENAVIHLDGVRFVADLDVSGHIRLAAGGRAEAELRAGPAGGPVHDVVLRWTAFTRHERPRLTGTLDGRPFSAPPVL